MARIFDTSIFYNENDMIEFRLQTLSEVIDRFVICEAAETHSGKPKPYNFDAKRFDKWKSKIIYVQVGELTDFGRNSWQREAFHRSCIQRGLVEADPNDWIVATDADEIVSAERMSQLKDMPSMIKTVKFELAMYYYDLVHRVQEGWSVGAARFGVGLDPNDIRRNGRGEDIRLFDSGWHFSWFGGADRVLQKLDSFMHNGDIAKDVPRDREWLKTKISEGRDIIQRDGFSLIYEPINKTLPAYILNNIDYYKSIGWIPT